MFVAFAANTVALEYVVPVKPSTYAFIFVLAVFVYDTPFEYAVAA